MHYAEVPTSLGELIRQARGDLSQAEVAKLVGVDQSTVSRWERDETVPNVLDAAALVGALGMSWSDFDPAEVAS
jgi:transcriptional regulator with XRE-family HTH domain